MTCEAAMFADFVSVRSNQTTEDALRLLREHDIRALPVLDAEGVMVGRFDFVVLLSNVLPTSLTVDMRGTGFDELMDHGLKLSSLLGLGNERDCAQRLKAVLAVPVEEIMDREVSLVHPATPLSEGIRLLVQRRGPLGVVEKGGHRLIGLITVQSAMRALMDRSLVGE
jgi:CBS domain-containing protein